MEHQSTPDLQPPNGQVDPEALARGFEPHDLKLRAVFVFIAGLAVTLVVVLSVIYAIMMALAAYDRSGDPIASPVTVKLPPVYAPIQPSLGFYGDEKNDHLTVDAEDMVLMREQTQQALNAPAGVTGSGRPHMPIADAMEKALPMLLTRAVIAGPPAPSAVPDGSYEGHFNDKPLPGKTPGVWSSDMKSLNNQGN